MWGASSTFASRCTLPANPRKKASSTCLSVRTGNRPAFRIGVGWGGGGVGGGLGGGLGGGCNDHLRVGVSNLLEAFIMDSSGGGEKATVADERAQKSVLH